MERYCEQFIAQDLQKKMVFIGGPRQVGKTVLSQRLCEGYQRSLYLNWDFEADRNLLLKRQWRTDDQLIVFDELHKYPKWKQWIKGVYDTKPKNQQYIVTGSARLDVYRQGGDSLMGRYHYWRLHPLTLDERPHNLSAAQTYHRLMTVGGFPEPFLQADAREARRWRRERFDRILQEDIRDVENVREIQLLRIFADALRERVGSMISLSNLARDLQISPKTAKSWLALLERMYLLFPIHPFTANIPRAIQKPAKVYFYDNADCIADTGTRLENLVATHLLKRLHFIEDYHGHRCQLNYIRDRDGREVDFVTVIDGKIHQLIEVKLSDDTLSKNLKYYKEKLSPKHTIQLVANLKRSYDTHGIRIITPMEYFTTPPWAST